MIHSFTIKNFYSFKGENTLSFVVNDKAPKTTGYFVSPAGLRLTKILAIFGHNASGKTNLLKALAFLQWFMVAAFTEDPEEEIFAKPFVFDLVKKPLEVSVNFEIDGLVYNYFSVVTSKRVLKEGLRVKGSTKFKALFVREWNDIEKKYYFPQKFGLTKDVVSAARENCSVIATAIRLNHSESQKIASFWKNMESNVSEDGKIDNRNFHIFNAAEFFFDNQNLKKSADNLLSKFDLGLSSTEILKKKEKNKEYYEIFGVHRVGKEEHKLEFPYESTGTQKLFGLLKNIFSVLSVGGIAVLDEFDTDLHPAMIPELLKLFLSKDTNPYNAQILFSAHSPQILNELDKYQIAFVEKDKNGCSGVWRLDEVSGVRPEDNLSAKYLAGAYGAIPDFSR